MWTPIEDWKVVFPLLPVLTVEMRFVWLKKCQKRILRDGACRTLSQYRVLPVSGIWSDR